MTAARAAPAAKAAPNLAWFYGDDAWGLDNAAEAVFRRLAAEAPGLERTRVSGDSLSAARLGERVATGSLFGGGTLVVVTDPAPLVRSKEDRDTLTALLGAVAPGNGIVFLEPTDGSNRRPAAMVALEKAVADAGGETRELRAPKEGQLTAWIEQRARERGLTLGPGAAKELATRVGGFVREGDVDRRRQGQLAVGELDKLALYRPDGEVAVEDVAALVAEVVPGSAWAFLDAVGQRRTARALAILERLLDATPELVVLAQLHRRIRELIIAADLRESGARNADIVKALGLKSYPAELRVEQARNWTLADLDAALEGLVELDATVRGAPGTPVGDAQRRMAFSLWIAERVTATT
jgi:DNA polymerase III delta subunit